MTSFPNRLKPVVREEFKVLLTRLGSWLPVGLGQDIGASMNYLALGVWMKAHGFTPPERSRDRYAVFRRIVRHVGSRSCTSSSAFIGVGACAIGAGCCRSGLAADRLRQLRRPARNL